MTREEQKKYREMSRYLETRTKEAFQQYPLKKKDFVFYLARDPMFYSTMLSMNQDHVQAYFCAKPFWLDDILWDILGMESNKTAPVSLRGIGAFTIQSKIREREYPVEDFAQIDGIVDRTFEELVALSENYREEDFLAGYGSIRYQQEVIEVIVLIHNGEYEKALELCCKKQIGYFGDVDKSFSELAGEYIRRYSKMLSGIE